MYYKIDRNGQFLLQDRKNGMDVQCHTDRLSSSSVSSLLMAAQYCGIVNEMDFNLNWERLRFTRESNWKEWKEKGKK